MLLTAKHIGKLEITPATIPANAQYPERKGFKLDGYYLNGSEQWSSVEECKAGLVGQELMPSKTGKSLVLVGSFVAPKTENLKGLLVQRSTDVTMSIEDLNDLF